MTTDSYSAAIPTDQPEQERPADPRPAWERVAYIWLDREVDHARPVDPTQLAAEVSVAPGFAADLVRVLRAHRQRDPELSELRTRLVGDQITAAYLARELPGDQRLDRRGWLGRSVPPPRSPANGYTHSAPASRPTHAWEACGSSRSATAAQPPSSSPRCRLLTPTVADPN